MLARHFSPDSMTNPDRYAFKKEFLASLPPSVSLEDLGKAIASMLSSKPVFEVSDLSTLDEQQNEQPPQPPPDASGTESSSFSA
jgi:hypothetical protein